MRVLIDTNLWISYLLTRNDKSTIRQVVQACLSGRVGLVVPRELVAELRVTVRYPHLVQRIRQDELELLLRQIRAVGEPPPFLPEETPRYSRDRKDDYLVAYGLLLEVDYLVTGDRDLLALGQIEQLHIVTPAAMRRILEAQAPPEI
jgi:putative PIN family toxin of toxin-antitoxin system